MRALVQRVTSGKVEVGGEVTGRVGRGMVVLLGVTHSDTADDAAYLAEKCVNLRIFDDEQGVMNRSLLETGGGILAVSQFTLYGDTVKGRRPFYGAAARPEVAEPLYEKFMACLRESGVHVESGVFGAEMALEIHNDGPVTLMLESKK